MNSYMNPIGRSCTYYSLIVKEISLSPPLSALLVEIMNETGLSLDRVYTLKGVRGMLLEMQNNPTRFLGRRVLYIHTGVYVCMCTCVGDTYCG